MHDVEASHAATTPFRSYRLLLVGAADAGSLDMAASILRRRGHRVEVDRALGEDLSLFDPYDLVVLELDARNSMALAFLGRLRQASIVPLLVLIPMTGRSQGIRALELGADCFIVFPFDRRELVARSEALIRRYRQAFSFFQSFQSAT